MLDLATALSIWEDCAGPGQMSIQSWILLTHTCAEAEELQSLLLRFWSHFFPHFPPLHSKPWGLFISFSLLMAKLSISTPRGENLMGEPIGYFPLLSQAKLHQAGPNNALTTKEIYGALEVLSQGSLLVSHQKPNKKPNQNKIKRKVGA